MCNLAYKHKKAEEKIHSFVYPPTIMSPTQQGFRNVFLALYLFFLEPLPCFFLVLFSPSRPELCKAVFRQLSVEKVRVKNLLVVRLDAQRVLGRLHVVVAGKLVGGQVVHFRPSPSSSIDSPKWAVERFPPGEAAFVDSYPCRFFGPCLFGGNCLKELDDILKRHFGGSAGLDRFGPGDFMMGGIEDQVDVFHSSSTNLVLQVGV